MSRHIEVDVEYNMTETIASMDECKYLCNEVCCHKDSKTAGAFVDYRWCEKCPLFTQEDGVLSNGIHV